MSVIYALINKEALSHICRGKHVSDTYIVERANIKADKFTKWLDPEDKALPTILQAKRISRLLHVPFAALYMNPDDIPLQKIPSIKNLRTLQGTMTDDSSLNIAIGDVLLEREYLISVSEEFGISIPHFSVSQPRSTDYIDWAKAIRYYFQIDLKEQLKCTSQRKFYLYLRSCVEKKGVLVQCFKDTPIEVARGVSIYFAKLPVIGINDNDRYPAKSFSIIHELVHLYKRESAFCNDMTDSSAWKEEVFCNAVAGELLVPRGSLEAIMAKEKMTYPYSVNSIRHLADKFSVSREVIIRRLLSCNRISEKDFYLYSEEFQRELKQEREERRIAKESGFSVGIPKVIYREAFDRTSINVSKALYYGYREEVYSKKDIANHLGIAQKHVDRYLTEVEKWNR